MSQNVSQVELKEMNKARALELLKEGYSQADIAKELGVSSDSVGRWKRQDKEYKQKWDEILRASENSIVNKRDDKLEDKVSHPQNTKVIEDDDKLSLINDKKEKLFDLLENYDKIKAIINQYDKVMTTCDNSMIIINLPVTEKEDARKTVRFNPVTWEKFEKFSDEHKGFTKKDLLSQALEDFMERYK